MIMLLAAAAAQTAAITANSRPSETAVITLEQPSSGGITSSPRIVAVPALTPSPARPSVAAASVSVRVSAAGRTLFNDTLRVAAGSVANYSENRSEAASTPCPMRPSYESTERSSLSIQLYLRENPASGQAVHVSVSWQRPAPGSGCGTDGTRSVQLSQTVQLDPGQNATIEGDAGLIVSLGRP